MLNSFDYETYMKQKLYAIIKQNKGVKLNSETLAKIERYGYSVIPPLE
jgi:hypothetical protein